MSSDDIAATRKGKTSGDKAKPFGIAKRDVWEAYKGAGAKVAAIPSVIDSCRRLRLSVRDYLTKILSGLANLPNQRLSALFPSTCAASG